MIIDAFYEQLVYCQLEMIVQKYIDIQQQSIVEARDKLKPYDDLKAIQDSINKQWYSLRQQMQQEIENLGVSIGRKIVDLMTKNNSELLQTNMEIMRYISTKFWKYIFGKYSDTLRKNNSCTYFELVDQQFKFLGRISGPMPSMSAMRNADQPIPDHKQTYKDRQKQYSYYIIGLIKGALKNFGLSIKGVDMNELGENPEYPLEAKFSITFSSKPRDS